MNHFAFCYAVLCQSLLIKASLIINTDTGDHYQSADISSKVIDIGIKCGMFCQDTVIIDRPLGHHLKNLPQLATQIASIGFVVVTIGKEDEKVSCYLSFQKWGVIT